MSPLQRRRARRDETTIVSASIEKKRNIKELSCSDQFALLIFAGKELSSTNKCCIDNSIVTKKNQGRENLVDGAIENIADDTSAPPWIDDDEVGLFAGIEAAYARLQSERARTTQSSAIQQLLRT